MSYKPPYRRSVAVGRDRDRGRGGSWTQDLARFGRGPGVGILVASLTVYLGFDAGGFFAGATATATLALCLLTVLGLMLVTRPFENFTPGLLVPLALLAAYAVWTLASAAWSDASGRALLEFDRALLYVLALAFFGMLIPGRRRLKWGIRGFATAAVVLCAAGLATRVAADVWPIAMDVRPERLSFPLTYWNALGLLAGLGTIACAHLSSTRREIRPVRVLAAAAMPLLAAVLLLTFSRASLALVPVGLLVYAAVARPRRLIATVLAVSLPVAFAMIASYGADEVSSADYASAAGVSQGHELAVVIGLCVVAAGLLRALLLRMSFDRSLDEWDPPPVDRRTVATAIGGGAVAVVLLAVAFGGPSWLEARYDSFVEGDHVGHREDPRGRLTSAGNNGRIPQWEAALDGFSEAPLTGSGAGTYQLLWAENRPYRFTVIDAHSLYVEVLGELGVVGFLLLGGALLAIFVALARRLDGEDYEAYAAVIALAAVWAVHAGVDWDWEMPAVTLWLFALAGLGLSRPRDGHRQVSSFEPGRAVRIVAAIGVGVLAVTPAAISVSQSRLDDAIADFDRGECEAAIDSALGSLDVLKVRPEPYEVIGYCDVRLGEGGLAIAAMENAVARDPENWETHYGLALVRAADGLDPMAALYEAERLNPRELSVQEAIRAMSGADPPELERQARLARLPF